MRNDKSESSDPSRRLPAQGGIWLLAFGDHLKASSMIQCEHHKKTNMGAAI